MKNHSSKWGKFGFTLIELLVVMAILAVLMGLSFPAIKSVMEVAKKNRARGEVAAMDVGLARFNDDNGFYPIADYISKEGMGTNEQYEGNSASSNYRTASSALFLGLMGKQCWKATNTADIGPSYVEQKQGWVFTDGESHAASAVSSSRDTYINTANFGPAQGAMKDPWGRPYGYYHFPDTNSTPVISAVFNRNAYDIWTVAGILPQTNASKWVGNWMK